MKKNTLGCFGSTLFVALFLAAMAVGMYFEGWTITHLWHWFIVPQFGLAELSIRYAVGMALMFTFFTSHLKQQDIFEKSKESGPWTKLIIYMGVAYGKIALYLAFGYIISVV